MKDLTLTGPTREREVRYRTTGEARRHAALLAMANGNPAPAVMYQRQVEAVVLAAVSKEKPVDDERLKRLEEKVNHLILLMEVQINGEKLHEVGGYSWGRASNGAAFVILYPASDHLKHKVCRVYEEDFGKLPPSINTAVIPDSAQEGNPDREQAIRQRIYKPCPPFKIATREGKETQMGPEVRFSRTVEATAGQQPAPKAPTPPKVNGNGGPSPKPSFFLPNDNVLVRGKQDEKAGTVVKDFGVDDPNSKLVRVKVEDKEFNTDRANVTLVPVGN